MCTTTTNLKLFIEHSSYKDQIPSLDMPFTQNFIKKIVLYLRYVKRKNTSKRTDTASNMYRTKIRDLVQISLLLPSNKTRVPHLPDNVLSETGSCISIVSVVYQ